ncbi:MAG TPA: SDR family oxidoreductase [Streptosporangiaceae bacterium]|nr:SDR family oxidoreductase [Streptosporangiaceae bacterium]
MTDLAGRTFLVTGANAGIGYATAQNLARRGGMVWAAFRSQAKGEAAVAAIRAETGSDQVLPLRLDLADLASVSRAAQTVLESGGPLHVLVNNAGVGGVHGKTADGFELHFGVNHLGHFALSRALLPLLTASAPARIVNVASDSHYQAKGINTSGLRSRTKSITGLPEYAVSKLCNVLHAAELGRRLAGTGVTTYALHPGVVASQIWRRVPWPVRPIVTRRMLTIEQGARTSLYCATSEEVASESGGYYDSCRPAEPSKVVTPELAATLWEYSERWTSVPGPCQPEPGESAA